MFKRFKHAAVAVALAASALAGPAFADDLAERRRLVEELMAITPYTDADGERDLLSGLDTEFRKVFGEAYTPYAQAESRTATLEAWRKRPSIVDFTRTTLVEKLTVDELREAIDYTNSPLAKKLRASTQKPGESELDFAGRVFTPEEFNAFVALTMRPGTLKYLQTIQTAATPIGESFGTDLAAALQARCPARTAPLPWCK